VEIKRELIGSYVDIDELRRMTEENATLWKELHTAFEFYPGMEEFFKTEGYTTEYFEHESYMSDDDSLYNSVKISWKVKDEN